MDMCDHSEYQKDQAPSLDSIATRVYGRKYVGQQTGDMLGNDSVHHYDMSEYEVDQLDFDMNQEPRQHYVDWDPITQQAIYAEGVNWFEYWLGLDESKFKHDFEIYRQAPEPRYVLADLIKRGELPYGQYLLRVSW
jgi:hypothetical protein